MTLWAIWTARRKTIHESVFQSPLGTKAFVDRYIKDLDMISSLNRRQATTPAVGARSEARQVPSAASRRWARPPQGYAKIKVDGGFSYGGDALLQRFVGMNLELIWGLRP